LIIFQEVAHQVLALQYSVMATLHLQIDDFEPGMTIRVQLDNDNDEYVIELDDGPDEPDEAPEAEDKPKVATADAQRFAFGGRRGG
jgi:hypothetical protein